MLINLSSMPGMRPTNPLSASFGDLTKLFNEPNLPMPGGSQIDAEFPMLKEMQTPQPGAGEDFSNILKNAIDDVDAQEQKARTSALDMALGQDVDPHTVMIAYAKASTMIHLASGISTRMAQDFTTLMNMQV